MTNKQIDILKYSSLTPTQRYRYWAVCDVLITGDCLSLEKYIGIPNALKLSEIIISVWGSNPTPVIYEEAFSTLMQNHEVLSFVKGQVL